VNDRIDFVIPDYVPVVAALLVVWWSCAIGAAICAPRGRAIQFAVVSLLFLGPLGVGFAAAAARPYEPPTPHGRHTVRCPRCDARQHVLTEDRFFQCWRCWDRYEIERGPFGRRIEVGRFSVGSGPRIPEIDLRPETLESSWRSRGGWADSEPA
jgi:hypothetical protein